MKNERVLEGKQKKWKEGEREGHIAILRTL